MPNTTTQKRAAKPKRRPAIKGGFHILVVPNADVKPNPDGLTVPLTVVPTGAMIRVVANSKQDDEGVSSWAFDKRSRHVVCTRLRQLAAFIEANAIAD